MYPGMGDQQILQFDRRNPLPAGLDDVFGTVGQRQEAMLVDVADIASAQPPLVELVGVVVAKIRASYPRPAGALILYQVVGHARRLDRGGARAVLPRPPLGRFHVISFENALAS